MRRITILVIAFFLILILNFIVLLSSVKAAISLPATELNSVGYCPQLLKYKGVIVKTHYIDYYYNGCSYPAYCLDKHLEGISENLVYSVNPSEVINDVGLWRRVINGYPYKSLEELGVANKEEAFVATKQAIYCYLFENEPSDYEAIGEAGERTLNALRQIVSNAENSTETQIEPKVNIIAENEEWVEDEKNENILYKIFSIKTNIPFEEYKVSIEGNVPKETQITSIEGNAKAEFLEGEKFKMTLLKDNLKDAGKIKIKIETQVKTKPVLYGASPSSEWQNYALTTYMYEDAKDICEITYPKIEKPKEEKPEKAPEKTPKKVVEKIEEKEKPHEEIKIEPIIEQRILPVTGM